MTAFKRAEKKLKPPISELFEDVFGTMPQNLIE